MVEILELQGYFPSWTALAFCIVGVVSILIGIAALVLLLAGDNYFDEALGESTVITAVAAFVGSIGLFGTFFVMDIFSDEENPMEAFDKQYPGISAIYQGDEQVNIFDYVGILYSENDFSTHEVSVFFEDGTNHEDVVAVFERSDRDNISHTFSFAAREDGHEDGIIHSKSQLVEARTGQNLEELTENGAAPAFGFDDDRNLVEYDADTVTPVPSDDSEQEAQNSDSSWTGALATVLKWTGAIIGSLVVSVFLMFYSAKLSNGRANKVRTKMREKA